MSKSKFNRSRLLSRLVALTIVSWLAFGRQDIMPSGNQIDQDNDIVLSDNIVLKSGYQSNPELKFAYKIPPKPVFASQVIARKRAILGNEPIITQAVPQTGSTPSDYDGLFTKYAGIYGVDERKLKVIAKCESRFNPAAKSSSGKYGGMYQYSASTWESTRKAMGADTNPELRFNAEAAIMTSAWKIAHGGIGAWPVCGTR